MRNTVIFTVSILLLTGGVYYIYDQNRDAHITGFFDLEPCTGSLTILYDNYVFDSSGRAEWGFSCLIEIGETAVLFDTGGEPEVLRHNIEAFDVDVSTIDCVVLSSASETCFGCHSTLILSFSFLGSI